MSKGRIKYVPPKALEQLIIIKKTYNLSDARAFDKMAEFVPPGMEIERAMTGTGFWNFLNNNKKKK